MKTLQISGDSVYGGDSYLLIRWCRYLAAKGWEVEVLTTDSTTIAELREIRGIDVVDNIYIPRDIVPGAHARAFVQLISLMRRKEYDVVHTYTATPGFLGRLAARAAGTPVILHHQISWNGGDYASMSEKLLYRPLEALATLASTRGICVSEATVDQARRYRLVPERKLTTICNGIEPSEFASADPGALRRELGASDDTLLIGNTARLRAQKDNQTAIQAIPHLNALLPGRPSMLLLAGEGPDRPLLEELIQSLGIEDQVRLLGFRQDIPSFLAGLDVFISPSLWEGLSISLMEAMVMGKPIVTTSIPPNAELIQHERTGLLIPPQSPEDLAQAIARFAQDPDLADRCGREAKRRVLKHYTIDRMFDETWDLYVDLLAERLPEGAAAATP